jgi:DNA-binding CsgD family transcriptional regulator
MAVAIERDRKRRKDDEIVSNAQALFETLTHRERDVLALIAAGLMNKQIAAEIGIAEITVKIHRGHIMKKWVRGRWPIWRESPNCSASAAPRRSNVKPKYDFPIPLGRAFLGYEGATIGSPFRREGKTIAPGNFSCRR